MEATISWQGGMKFDSTVGTGGHLSFDGDDGPTPMESLLCSLAACTAMDVVSILEKKRQKVTAYRVEVSGERPEAGAWPRPFTSIKTKHILTGVNLDPSAVERAIELSDEKYCSVSATLRHKPALKSEFQIEEAP